MNSKKMFYISPVKNINICTLALFLSVLTSLVSASELSVPNDFTSGTAAVAAEVNANFDETETAVNDNHSRITVLESALTDIQSRLTSLEDSAAGGPAVNINTYLATDLVFLFANGNLTIPVVEGNVSDSGTAGEGTGWHALPGLDTVAFDIEEDNTVVLFIAEGEAVSSNFSSFDYMEAGLLVNGAGPGTGAVETMRIVTDDNISSGGASWHIVYAAELDAGSHTFSVVVRSQHGQNQGTSISIDGRSGTGYPGKIKTTMLVIKP